MTDDKELRARLADELTEAGILRSPEWRRAVLQVPRHEFLRGGFFRRVDAKGRPTAWEPVMPDDPAWLSACYTNESLVTQIAGTVVPGDIEGRIYREPTSSSTLPGLVVQIMETARIRDGDRLLLVGAGTGASTALACHRLGDDLVTAIEYDQDVATRARQALAACGMHPDLAHGDGLHGFKENAPYDRLVATVGVREIPPDWLEQVRPRGHIVATIVGWLHASEMVRLTVNEDGTAIGRFLGDQVSFMLARPHLPPPIGMLPEMDGTEREVLVHPGVIDYWTARLITQAAAPRAQRLMLGDEHVFLDVESGAWAAVRPDGDTWAVRQGGGDALWDRIEDDLLRWTRAGQPALASFIVTVGPEGQRICW
ncbi:ATP-grasp peptide maturase system methyltransferase [Streptomyces sp. NPDC012769]|uniref:ATP-grasp peptide maturase system methyltransferase n=1 Tax=Streptomyces sp. NPDC012769 TaxID=3364848 RepID=UPI0036787BA6